MPAFIDKCVNAIMKDPNFKPLKGRSKEESAYAICWSKYNEHKKVIKKLRGNKSK